MLSDTHSPHDCGWFVRGENFSSLFQLFSRDTSYLRYFIQGIFVYDLLEFFKTLRAIVDIGFIFPPVFKDNVHQAVDQSNICAGFLADVQHGKFGHIDFPGISHNQFGSAF
jgi:hypothetical protein